MAKKPINDTPKQLTSIVVLTKTEELQQEAQTLAKHLKLNLCYQIPESESTNLVLRLDDDGLALVENGQALRGDFTQMLPRLKHNNINGEILVKAAKIKGAEGPLTAIDATAGMGEDALLLAAAGFSVQLYEYDPVIAALLRDTLRRAAFHPELAPVVARMRFSEGDSLVALSQLQSSPDVVLLDPMFPARQKSGLIKKKFQLLQQLERPCENEEELLRGALASTPRKIVIKRPLKGPFLANRKPDYSLKGKTIRYDCIMLPGNRNVTGSKSMNNEMK